MNYEDCFDELYTYCIFPFLDFRDIYSLSLTCSYFCDLYRNSTTCRNKNQDIIEYFKNVLLFNVKNDAYILNDICTFGTLKMNVYSEDLPNGVYFFQKIIFLNILPYFYFGNESTNHIIFTLIFVINKKHTTYIVYKYKNLIKDVEIREEKILNDHQYVLKIF